MKGKLKQKFRELPKKPGVYLFKDKLSRILYVGKANNLQKRVKSHFKKGDNQPFEQRVIEKTADIDWIQTDSASQALILEQELIRKYQPRYNIEWRDDKNYFYVGFTRQEFPRVFITHQPGKLTKKQRTGEQNKKEYLGPYINGKLLKQTLANLRKIFPFRTCKNPPEKPCLWWYLGLCPAHFPTKNSRKKYQMSLKALRQFLKIYLLQSGRIEGYDISNLSGTLSTGSMVVFRRNKPQKSAYRRFRIKRVKGQNDVKSMKEVLKRRLKHNEWQSPALIVLDGGKAQLKAAKNIDLPVVALAKMGRKDAKIYTPYSKKFLLLNDLPPNIRNTLLFLRDEAHRFAITYHKKRREKHYAI